ncbi:MAG: hypothetical protein QW431_04495 [Conexivisphaerales archaeon]
MGIAKEAIMSDILSLYVDSTGRFRPERILQMINSDDLSILKGLDFLSATDSTGLVDRINRIFSLNKYDLIIWDGLAYPFFETSSSHKLGLVSRMLSIYAVSGHKVIASDPLVEITGLPAGHIYTDPYVHLRLILKRKGNKLFIEGANFKKEYIVTSNGVFFTSTTDP